MPQLALLWTDVLVWLLVAAVLAFVFYARRHEHLRVPWREVRRRRLAMGAAVLLGTYALVALLDSVHFYPRLTGAADEPARYASEPVSVLDLLLGGLRERSERTYSAPFAWQAYTKETVDLPDGEQARIYPRLAHGGSGLADPAAQRAGDIALRILRGLLWAALIGGALLLAGAAVYTNRQRIYFKLALRRLLRGTPDTPWRTIIFTAGALIALIAAGTELAAGWHLLGTDKVGQDVLYQAIKSIRTGLLIGTLTTLIMLPFALLLGIAAGYFRGRIDDAVQYLYTTLNSIPGVLLIAAAVLTLQVYMANHPEMFTSSAARADLRLLFLTLILGLTSWTGLARLLRGEALKLSTLEYVQSATALGVRDGHILTRHILPNVMHIVLITVVLDFSGLVLAEAVLSYVGVGVDPTMNSWGNMINSARLEIAREPVVWWPLLAAFLFMFTLVLAANLFADAVRDAFDPRLREIGAASPV